MTIPGKGDAAAAVERQLGGRVVSVRRQPRWRPTWFVTVDRAGETFDVVVRGERPDSVMSPLRHEFDFHTLLEAAGVPVPHLYGWNDDLDAVVMEFVPGRPDFDGVADDDRDRVVDEYLQAMVAVHRLDPAPFRAAGIREDATDAHTRSQEQSERRWRAQKDWPDPFIEFCLGWARRHPVDSRGRCAPILADTGQFHHEGGHLVAILDLEFGHLGDPMLDLAGWRMRDTIIPFGDMARLYARYEELSGEPVDLEAIQRYHFAGAFGNEMMFAAAVHHPGPDTDLMTYMQWDSDTNLMATEFLAEYLDVELPTVAVPAARHTRTDETFRYLVEKLGRLRPDDADLGHEIRLAFRAARHLQRVNEIGEAVIEDDLDDLHRLLGWRPGTWHEGDEALEAFVLADADTGRHDEELVALFHRRNLRLHAQLGPPGSKMVRHVAPQRFDGRPWM